MESKAIYILMLTALMGLSAQPAGEEEPPGNFTVYTFEIVENIAPPEC